MQIFFRIIHISRNARKAVMTDNTNHLEHFEKHYKEFSAFSVKYKSPVTKVARRGWMLSSQVILFPLLSSVGFSLYFCADF